MGRLDYDAEGLLLLTNDGELAMRLAHPRYQVPRTYLVKVKGVLGPREMARIEKGVRLDDGMSPAMKVTPIKRLQKNSVVRVTLHEGRNRVIKRTFEAIQASGAQAQADRICLPHAGRVAARDIIAPSRRKK